VDNELTNDDMIDPRTYSNDNNNITNINDDNSFNNSNDISVNNDNGNDNDSDSDQSIDLDNVDMNNLEVQGMKRNNDDKGLNKMDELRQNTLKRLKVKDDMNTGYEGPVIVKMRDNDNMELNNDNDSGSESETESETDSDMDDDMSNDDTNDMNQKRKIVFLNRNDRDKLKQNINENSMENEMKMIDHLREKRNIEVTNETKESLYEYIKNIENNELNRNTNDNGISQDMPDDRINENDREHEYTLWKIREIERIKREQEIKIKKEKEKNELLKRRQMSDIEILRDNKKLGIKQPKKKRKMKFMQKYYHKGAFFNDADDDIYTNDITVERNLVNSNRYMEATGKDKYTNYDKLRKIQQKKRFGLMSQSKWTHLLNEDTTMMDDNNIKNVNYYKFRHRAKKFNDNNKNVIKRGGQGGFDRPSYKSNKYKNKRYK